MLNMVLYKHKNVTCRAYLGGCMAKLFLKNKSVCHEVEISGFTGIDVIFDFLVFSMSIKIEVLTYHFH